MDRHSWLAARQAAVVAAYDSEAPTYDDHLYPASAQQEWVARTLRLVPPGGTVLDAPCGTGRYFAAISAAGHDVFGVDQSAGMLARAAARGIAKSVERVALQDLPYDSQFDVVLTIDAMENVSPEDWPRVAANLSRAVRPGGHVYMSVEEVSREEIDKSFAGLQAAGLPAVHGEVVEGDVAGYHFYPARERVLGWLAAAGLVMVDEGYSQEDGWGYRHLLMRVPKRTTT